VSLGSSLRTFIEANCSGYDKAKKLSVREAVISYFLSCRGSSRVVPEVNDNDIEVDEKDICAVVSGRRFLCVVVLRVRQDKEAVGMWPTELTPMDSDGGKSPSGIFPPGRGLHLLPLGRFRAF
jgi:hypothetical protein